MSATVQKKKNSGLGMNAVTSTHLFVYGAAALLSIVFSSIVIWQDDVVNPDSFYYLQAASSFLDGSWRESNLALRWGVLPIMMAMAQWLTGLSLIDASLLIMILLNTGTVLAFIRLVAQLNSRPAILLAAAIVVLSNPHLNEYRTYIIRDPGYWCFYLLAISLFIQYFREPVWRHAIGWALCMIAATSFRVEGVIFFAALPLLLLLRPETTFASRWVMFVRANAVGLFCLALGMVVLIVLSAEDRFLPLRLNELGIWISFITQDLFVTLGDKAEQLKAIMLPMSSEKYALHAVVLVLVMLFLMKLVSVLHLPFVLLATYSLLHVKAIVSKKDKMVLWWVILLNILILCIYLSRHFFLQGRYVIPLVFMILLVVPFALVQLYDQWKDGKQQTGPLRWAPHLVAMLLVWMTVDGLTSFGPSKQYIRDSAEWLKNKTPANIRLISNDRMLAYYSEKHNAGWVQVFTDSKLDDNLPQELADRPVCLALKVSRKRLEQQDEVEASIRLQPLKEFSNRRGDKVVIYCME